MRRLLALTVLVLGIIGFAAPAAAKGGWALTVVDPFDEPSAGEDLDVTFTILQHGRTPVDVEGVLLLVDSPDGATTQYDAESTGEVGRYRATVSFPDDGRYHWRVIQGWFGEYDLGDLDVTGASATGAAWVVPAAGVGAVGAGLVGALAWRRRRQPGLNWMPQVPTT